MSNAGEKPAALVLDLGSFGSGVATYVASRGPILAYLAAIRGVGLGERPIVVGGQLAGHFDPLASQPAAARQLAQAQDHARELGDYLQVLHRWTTGGMASAVANVVPQLEILRDILAAIPDDGEATAEQSAQMVAAIGLATFGTQWIGLAATQMREGIRGFLSQLAADHAALASGETAIGKVAEQVSEDAKKKALPLLLPPYQGIGQVILQIGAAQYAELRSLEKDLGKAIQGHQEIGGGISALANAVENLFLKYTAAEKAVARAASAEVPAVVRQLEPALAIRSWQDFLRFLTNSAL